MVFVDSNVPMYVAGRDHPLREPARRFLERARAGEVEICTSTEVLQEILCVRDAVQAAVMFNNDISEIATFDEGFDRIRGVTRLLLS